MHPGRDAIANCPHGEDHRDCTLRCKFNHFDDGELTIHAWELRCLDCGLRQTVAFRSDEDDWDRDATDPAACPFCDLAGGQPGKDLCIDA